MAKGVEDNAFYRTSRLTSLNEVGGDPDVFAISPEQFHDAMAARQRDWPWAMTALSTHDTKRSEDVRARIAVLAEVPGEWESTITELQRLAPMPDAGFGQPAVAGGGRRLADLAGADLMPTPRRRCARPASTPPGPTPTRSSRRAVHAALDAAYDDDEVTAVVESIVARIEPAGRSNALAASCSRSRCRACRTSTRAPSLVTSAWSTPTTGARSTSTLPPASLGRRLQREAGAHRRGTAAARDRPELFTSYDAVPAEGPAADHVLAFDRGGAITVVTRLPLGLEAKGGWGDTVLRLPDGRDVCRRRTRSLSDVPPTTRRAVWDR